jgi:hypothetical protein
MPFLGRKKLAPWLAIGVILAATAAQLRWQGRLWTSASGHVRLWVGDAASRETSQQFLDPYSITHVLHGFILCALITWLLRRWPLAWQLAVAVLVESLWEILENSRTVIERYRQATIAIGYEGDTILNSIGDILSCAAGFWLASRLPWRWTLALLVATEIALLVWIRDSLALNVLMLLWPLPAVKNWQLGH